MEEKAYNVPGELINLGKHKYLRNSCTVAGPQHWLLVEDEELCPPVVDARISFVAANDHHHDGHTVLIITPRAVGWTITT